MSNGLPKSAEQITGCKHCDFYLPTDEDLGDCRYNPPVVVTTGSDHQPLSVWPTVHYDDACGKWRTKIDESTTYTFKNFQRRKLN